jgi:predicted 3-demethylubiquinone-9 3-methyltransferase (glyoxalase superfamily)
MDRHQQIIPRIRLQAGDHGVVGAARFYTDVFRPFEEAGMELGATGATGVSGTTGPDDGVELTVAGLHLHLIDAADSPGDAGISPATNFMVNLDPLFFGWSADAGEDDRRAASARTRAVLDTVWEGLVAEGATVLMPLGEYPFSARYGWVLDRFGVSWQLMLTDPTGEPRPALLPSFLFCGPAQNKAREALETWTRAFGEVMDGTEGSGGTDSGAGRTGPGTSVAYREASGPVVEGSVMFADARLAGLWITAMDSGVDQPFTFTDAVAFRVYCDSPVQAEMLRRELGLDSSGTDRFGVRWEPVAAQRTGSGEAR